MASPGSAARRGPGRSVRLPDARGGTVSGRLSFPARPGAPWIVLAHGAGNDLRQPLLVALHDALAARGAAVLRFNFPFTEARRRRPDPLPALQRCYRAVLETLRQRWMTAEAGPLVIGGKSLGGRVATLLQAERPLAEGLLLLGYPLHPAGRPERLRTAHLAGIAVPMYFVAGTRDPLCRLDLLRSTLAALPAPTRLHVVPDGDHSFRVLRRSGRTQMEVYAEIAGAAAAWLGLL